MTALAACTAHTHYAYRGSPPDSPGVSATSVFDHRHTPSAVSLIGETNRAEGYATQHFRMQAGFTNGQPGNRITGTYFDSRRPGQKALVIVLPVWGVSSYPSDRITEAILRRSQGAMNVLQVDGERRLMDWEAIEHAADYRDFVQKTGDSARRLRHTVEDLRRLLDWGEARPEIDAHRIGLVGFSISAVVGSLVIQNDARVRSAALVMGGADIAAILRRCPRSKGRTRIGVTEQIGLSAQQYEQTIEALFEGLDPSDQPRPAHPDSLLMVDAARDECIPESSRNRWWRALGQPERITMHYGHRGAFLAMTPLGFYFLRDRIYEHLAGELLGTGRGSRIASTGRSTAESFNCSCARGAGRAARSRCIRWAPKHRGKPGPMPR